MGGASRETRSQSGPALDHEDPILRRWKNNLGAMAGNRRGEVGFRESAKGCACRIRALFMSQGALEQEIAEMRRQIAELKAEAARAESEEKNKTCR